MAVIVTKDIKRKRIMLGAFAALVLGSGLIIYFGIFSNRVTPSETDLPPESGESTGEVASFPQVSAPDFKVDILADERFKNLQSSPGVPLEVATNTAGKINPFSE